VAGCPNRSLLEQIRALKERLRRYEYAYMRDVGRVELSTRHHDRIASALAVGDTDQAVHWLERNWRISLERLGGWLASLEEPPAGPAPPSPRRGARGRAPAKTRARRR
jgi:DNA-binding GntR family transcriptional regulator